jgi:hypothetical protein
MLKFLHLRWILPVLGLIVFSVISYSSFRWHRQYFKDNHIFLWSSTGTQAVGIRRARPRNQIVSNGTSVPWRLSQDS